MDVNTEDLSREGVLGGELFSPLDALLPGIGSHWAIMGLRLAASNWVVWSLILGAVSELTMARPRDYILRNFCVPSRFLM